MSTAVGSLCYLLTILLILPLHVEGVGDSHRVLCASNSGLCNHPRRDLLQVTPRTSKPKKGKNKPSSKAASTEDSPWRPSSLTKPLRKKDGPKAQKDKGSYPEQVVLIALRDDAQPRSDPTATRPLQLALSSPPRGQRSRGGANNRMQTIQNGARGGEPEAVSLRDIILGRIAAPEMEEMDPQEEFEFPEKVTLELEGFTPYEQLPAARMGGPTDIQQGSPGGAIQRGIQGGPANIQGGIQGGIQRGPANIQGGIQGGPANIQGGIQGGPANIQGGVQRGIQGGPANFQGGIQGGIPGSNIQGGIGRRGPGNIQGGVAGGNAGIRTGPVLLEDGAPGGTLPGPVQGGASLPGGQGGIPAEKAANLTAELIEAPPEGQDAEFFGHANADLCPCSDAVPSGAFNCMQVRFQGDCSLRSILNGPVDVPEGFCQVTCGRCDCCTDMLTMSSRRGLDIFRKIFQTMADAEGSRSIARSLQNPSFATTVFAPTNDAFSRMLHLLNMTFDDFLNEPSLMNQVMTYHVLLGPTATSSEELSTGFLGTTLPTVNSAAFVSLNTSGPILGVGGIGSYANVVVPDVFSCKSIFHVVDEVLLPFSSKGFQG